MQMQYKKYCVPIHFDGLCTSSMNGVNLTPFPNPPQHKLSGHIGFMYMQRGPIYEDAFDPALATNRVACDDSDQTAKF